MDIKIRKIEEKDVEQTKSLLIRLKRFNSEHDPLFNLSSDIENVVKNYIVDSLKRTDIDIFIAEYSGKIVGVIIASIYDRKFYVPEKEVRIMDLYVLPEFRKKGLGRSLLEHVANYEKEKGCSILTVEFPSENLLAHKFYTSMGMRSLISIYGKTL
ncbi:MAG: GNAT family N-acetyltransferase [Thermoplasmata archaeon]